ncbi:hypothetical protein GGF32_005969 [Allomyces javanicus]|nr:hypothetical protein GGF32_005969 [Allomyces javanicus]
MADSKPSAASLEQGSLKVKGNALTRFQQQYREYLGEFFGTFVMLLFGDGVVAQTVLSNGAAGDHLSIHIGWCLAVVFGIYVSGHQSGAHLNPSVTVSLAVHQGFPWRKVPGYILAQMLGAFLAAIVVFLNYYSAIDAYDGGVRTVPQRNAPKEVSSIATAGIFATYPAAYMTTVGAFFSEFIATSILLAGIYAVGDARNSVAPKTYGPIAVGLLVLTIGVALGVETGYALNPARDFGPRLASFVCGYGADVFTAFEGYFWIPIVAPVLGGVFGGYMFKAFCFFGEADN